MKLIYITGAPCCGKTTLANRLIKQEDAAVLSFDAFSKAVRYAFPDFKLYTDEISIRPSLNVNIFIDLIEKYINCYFDDYDNTLIVEGCHFTLDEFFQKFPESKIIALGIREKENALKQINKKEWMRNLSDERKNIYVNQIVEYSDYLKVNAGKYLYYDISEIESS